MGPLEEVGCAMGPSDTKKEHKMYHHEWTKAEIEAYLHVMTLVAAMLLVACGLVVIMFIGCMIKLCLT